MITSTTPPRARYNPHAIPVHRCHGARAGGGPGRATRPRPLVGITLIGPAGAAHDLALLDTGADDTVFPDAWAARVGIDLSGSVTRTAGGVGGGSVTVRYATVTLRLSDGAEQREWAAIVGFVSGPLQRPLLGFAGCLQYFTASFHGELEVVEIMVNGLYAGS